MFDHWPEEESGIASHSGRRCLPVKKALVFAAAFLFLGLVGVAALNFAELKSQYSKFRSQNYINRAKKALDEGKLTAARMMLQNAYRHTPENPDVMNLFIELLLKDGSPDVLQLMLQKHVQSPDLNNTRQLLNKAVESKKYLVVAGYLQDFLSKFPDDAEVHRLCAEVFRNLMLLQNAEQCLERALSLEPQNILAKIELASLRLDHPDKNKSESARETLEDIRKNGGQWGSLATKALADDAWEKDHDLARRLYGEILQRNPEDWHCRLRLFRLICRQNPERSGTEMEALWNLAKNSSQRLELLLAILKELGAEQVLEWKNKLQAEELEDAGIRIVLIRALWDKGKYKEALDLATLETFFKPPVLERALLQYWAYKCQFAIKDESTARRTMDSLKKLISEDQLTAILFSNELFATGQPKMALSALEEAAQGKNAGFAIMASERLFKYYKSISDIEGMIRVHEYMLRLFPDNALVQNNMATLLSLSNKDPTRALNLAESAYFLMPSHPVIVSNYAHILSLNGKNNEAQKLIESLDQKQFTEGMKLQRAHVLFLSGKSEEAAKIAANINTQDFLKQEVDILNKILTFQSSQEQGVSAARRWKQSCSL